MQDIEAEGTINHLKDSAIEVKVLFHCGKLLGGDAVRGGRAKRTREAGSESSTGEVGGLQEPPEQSTRATLCTQLLKNKEREKTEEK